LFFLSTTPGLAYRYALLVGHNGKGGSLSALKYAEKDAQELAQVLERKGGFRKEHILLLKSPQPALIDQALDSLNNLLKQSTTPSSTLALLFYSGHADESHLLLGKKKYPLQKIKNALDRLPANVRVGVFDACHSGSLARAKGASWGLPFYLQENSKVSGQVIIASSTAQERSQESENLKASVFSHHWTNGLLGNADISQDRRITLHESYQYAYQRTLETSALTQGGLQHPSFQFNLVGEGDIVLTDLSESTSGVEFSSNLEGRILIFSKDYARLWGDFFKNPGKPSYIALDTGMYTAIHIQGTTTKFSVFRVPADQSVKIFPHQFHSNPITNARKKGILANQKESEIFAPIQPWSLGLGMGSSLSLSQELSAFLPRMLSFRLYSQYALSPHINLQISGLGIFPGNNWGLLAGLEYQSLGKISFLATGAAGISSLVKTNFWEDMGPALELGGGLKIPMGLQNQLVLKFPWRLILNKSFDQSIGVEVLIHFGLKGNFIHRL